MAACATCSHPSRKAIESKMREGIPQGLISLWTRENPPYVSRNALGRHQRDHLGISVGAGRKPLAGSFLEDVVSDAHEGLRAGEYKGSVALGLTAQRQLDDRDQRNADRDLVARITMALTNRDADGNPLYVGPGDEIEAEVYELPDGSTYDPAPMQALQAQYAALLPSGDEPMDELMAHDRATTLARIESRP
jgi:hypothetical protein